VKKNKRDYRRLRRRGGPFERANHFFFVWAQPKQKKRFARSSPPLSAAKPPFYIDFFFTKH
jgi:hypothetical protein